MGLFDSGASSSFMGVWPLSALTTHAVLSILSLAPTLPSDLPQRRLLIPSLLLSCAQQDADRGRDQLEGTGTDTAHQQMPTREAGKDPYAAQ